VHRQCVEKREKVVTTTLNHKTKDKKKTMANKMTNF
jgi:hypothetical protein